ncbi:MAG: PfkB family carbohydrate kinase [Verrucomicrobia bacterium]|nr:PfkB family carbohydrate kinase [Verrucomicrobiota bacterium]MDA1204082.1 PfkB family carbohydrate kinase [Verrucomicrobiota bacterium]
MSPTKIIPFAEAPALFDKLRGEGKRLVQCHGTFDLVHPGHIVHLEDAKKLGDVLVVTVTDEKHVNKGPGRPYFNDALRARTLAALECVDYVVLVPHTAAVEAIETVKPNIYCKGTEYADAANDVTGNIHDDVATAQKHGGEVRYLGEVVFSSTRLINRHFETANPEVSEFCGQLATHVTPQDLADAVAGFAGLRVLVVGDTIFDKYAFVKVQGLTSKNRIISGRYLEEEAHAGGALAVYRHIKQFTPNVRLVSLLGTEDWLEPTLRMFLPTQDDATVRDPDFVSIIKQRYVEPVSEGKDLSKLFSVNYVNATPPLQSVVDRVLGRLEAEIKNCDVVVLADFGHGLMQQEVRDFLQNSGVFLALNCQTNSNNHGFNIISRQYRRADVFSLDEQELLLSCGHRHVDFSAELDKLRTQLASHAGWLTRGAVQTIGIDAKGHAAACPPLGDDITDTIGAGDAFFSVMALAARNGLPVDLTTFLGQLAGSQAVKIVGNREPISKAVLLKSGMALLNRDPA